MAAMVGLSHFQITVQVESTWISGLGPSLLLPFIFIPLLISSGIQKEHNNRKKRYSLNQTTYHLLPHISINLLCMHSKIFLYLVSNLDSYEGNND